MDDAAELSNAIEDAVRQRGKTPEQAATDLGRFVNNQALLEEALHRFYERAQLILDLEIPGGFVKDAAQPWYTGPRQGDRFWPPMRDAIAARLPADAVHAIDEASTKVVAHLPNPAGEAFDGRGLVIGYVQSGKTASYTAVISKAADAGYKLIIVLSGVHEALRAQTQRRLDSEIVGLLPHKWHSLTTPETDFMVGSAGRPDAILSGGQDIRVIAIVKKNAARLRKLYRWADRASQETLLSCPVLLIDDEADQASINTGGDDDPTAINDRIRKLLGLFPRSSYVGYTATPFANVLIGAKSPTDDDLYPRDFIFSLPKPDGYFGSERIFGRDPLPLDEDGLEFEGLDLIREIPAEESALLQPRNRSDRGAFEPVLTPSLERAVLYFWIATAVRHARGHADEHSSMLIHTTMYADTQAKFKPLLALFRGKTLERLATSDALLLGELRSIWADEHGRVASDRSDDYERVVDSLPEAIRRTNVVIENSTSQDRLRYDEPGSVQIVIGGNVLSRGLTLEGLVVSYFLRSANAYDTLLQMGRWFGYRPGYEDLQRIWMTIELQGYFADLATVEQEIRYDIDRYETEGLTPRQFGPRLRTHPALSITSDLKMQHARLAEVSFAGQLVQTILFHHRDLVVTEQNMAAAKGLASRLQAIASPIWVRGSFFFRDVPVEQVGRLLREYRFHEGARALSTETLTGYIESQNRDGLLRTWTVAFIGKLGGKLKSIGDALDIGLLERSKMAASDADTARLGIITSGQDLILDLPAGTSKLLTIDELHAVRGGTPLLLLYLIDRDSQPKPGIHTRLALEAADDLVGVALLFPPSANPSPQAYMTADLSGFDQEILDYAPEIDDAVGDAPAA